MPDVIDNTAANRYEIHEGDAVAFLSYRMKGDAIEYLHSETPPALQGKGYAGVPSRVRAPGTTNRSGAR